MLDDAGEGLHVRGDILGDADFVLVGGALADRVSEHAEKSGRPWREELRDQ